MHKVLIVGLGGSGGKTLAFLMDELKVRLGEEWAGKLPECWKFVHIDVPVVADTMGSSLATPVGAAGGTYVGLAAASVPYSNYDTAAMSALINQNPSALDLAARWRPDPKKADAIAVSGGAGAFRAVGRVVTVAKAGGIYSALQQAINDLSSSQANADLAALKGNAGHAAGQDSSSPLVFLVSSLAGGSGASMVLDVADMIRGLTKDKIFNGQHSAAFLYTADVFASLGIASGGPGSLATISELISAMSRQQEPWTSKEWDALGIGSASVPTATGRGPAMIFPVGAKSQGIPFGETPEDVFRGFSRMLAPLFIDENIQNEFFAYMVTNMVNERNAAGDSSGLAKDPITGATVPGHFAGWGSAVLTMGRERYAEYAAQRVARDAVEVLVNGFEDQDFIDKKINLQQAVQRQVEAIYPLFAELAGLSDAGSADSKMLLERVVPTTLRQNFANSKSLELNGSFGQSGTVVAVNLKNYFNRSLQQVKSSATDEGLRAISEWTLSLQARVEDAFLQIIAQKGIRVGIDSLKKLSGELANLQRDLDGKIAGTTFSLDANLISRVQLIAKQGNNPVQSGGGIAKEFLRLYAEDLKTFTFIEAARVLSPILADFSKSFLQQLTDEATSILEGLDYELRKNEKTVVTAAYREAPVSQWPKDGKQVPPHFEPAVNEVLIDGVDQFPNFFDTHVSQAVAPINQNVLREAARQILTRTRMQRNASGDGFEPVVGWNWKRTALGSHPNIDRTKTWQPKELITVSGATQSAAAFNLHLTYKEILNHARVWVDLPSCPFRKHSDQGINSWLEPAEGLSSQESQKRLDELRVKLNQAIKLASPLVQIDDAAVQLLHGANRVGTKYSFSAIPLSSQHPIITELQSNWSADAQGARNSSDLRDACSTGSDKGEIFILGKTASPYVPMVFQSLTEPIRNEWSNAVSTGNTGYFWEWRRARPLRHFVPFSKRHLAAFMQGWVVGRITGHIQLDDARDGTGSKVVRVLDPRDGKWADFPKNLLGVTSLGVPKQAFGADESSWNVPPALLESLPLAMAHCQGLNLEPIKPYMAIINLGLSLKVKPLDEFEPVGGAENIINPLDDWYNTGGTTGFEPQIASAQGSTPEERRANAKTWLNNVSDHMKDLLKTDVTLDNFWTINREYELAPEVVAATATVTRELERTNLGTAIGGSTQVASGYGASDNSFISKPTVEG